MKMVIRTLTALLAIALLSGCSPASKGLSPTRSDATSSPSSAATAQEPAAAPSPMVVPVVAVRPPTNAPAATTPKAAATGTALAAEARLTVKGRAPKTGYTRDQFGQAWFDTDRNGCDR